jgi:putative endonuclease
MIWVPAFAGMSGVGVSFFTYMMASQRNGTLYAGSTDDLYKRYTEHAEGHGSVFTAKYTIHTLVWFEAHPSRRQAFTRERQIKEWRRSWKLRLIEELNPAWRDLGKEFERIAPYDLLLELTQNSAHPGEGRDPDQVR